ncbi:hypothetical protein KCP74_01225 [Salmonella enterica subsp. enterica]|nr:hypothetical protein KCP74_01225 [Salmonella enterica subsp. enterica]
MAYKSALCQSRFRPALCVTLPVRRLPPPVPDTASGRKNRNSLKINRYPFAHRFSIIAPFLPQPRAPVIKEHYHMPLLASLGPTEGLAATEQPSSTIPYG